MPEDENGEAMPRRRYCLTMPPAHLPHEGCCWASAMLSLSPWFARIGLVPEPYFQLPTSGRCMRRLFRFRLGAYALPIGMGRRLRMARVARVCPLCPGMHLGDERYHVECPAFDDIRRGFQNLVDDSHGAMRLLMWHPFQKDVASCLLQLLDRIDETLT